MDGELRKIETPEMTCKGCVFNGDTYTDQCMRPEGLECMDPEEGREYIFVGKPINIDS